jgi:predicted nucleic acid-binding protein
VSELGKKNPNPNVSTFIRALPQESLYISVITVGEITKGIANTSDKNKKRRISLWLEKLTEWFKGNIISLDSEIMIEWGKLVGSHKRTLPLLDSLLGATCLDRNLTLLTRNTKDFADIDGIVLLNPWKGN